MKYYILTDTSLYRDIKTYRFIRIKKYENDERYYRTGNIKEATYFLSKEKTLSKIEQIIKKHDVVVRCKVMSSNEILMKEIIG